MEEILEQEVEYKNLNKSYKDILYKFNVSTEKLKTFLQALPLFSEILLSFNKEHFFNIQVLGKYKNDEGLPPQVPGIPGFQEKYFQTIADLYYVVLTLSEDTGNHIKNDITKTVQNLLHLRLVTIQKYDEQVQNAKNEYKTIKQNCKNNYNQLIQMHKDLVHLHAKQDKKKIQALAEKYVLLMNLQKQSIHNLNLAYLQFSRAVQEATHNYYETDKYKAQNLLESFSKLTPIYLNFAETNHQIFQRILEEYQKASEENHWKKYFVEFVIKNHIVRTEYDNISFNTELFPFDDPDLVTRITSQIYVKKKNNPLLLSLATHDFVSENPNELSIRKGQVVFLYEPPFEKWVLASTDSQKPQGYVPSAAVDVCDVKTGISKTTKLPDGEFMSLYPGEVIILHEIIDSEKKIWSCSKLGGTSGNVYESDIVIEDS